ncbi:endonuclease VII [Gordonia phage SteveFrench]|uniref:HNH endonuclease n=1 Tax=Gordonia phage SteveFrench TaxID=2079281 RepID=A0A2K9VED2_9CAUD|nr:endonuclease VII [Gordonia phage SteveFrench]AUV60620.1 HNH endonuclease [Gordonia phage SteveFrench]
MGRRPVMFDDDGLKPCSSCKERLPRESFDRNRRMASGYASQCKTCFRNKGYTDEASRSEYRFQRKYGISMQEYDRMFDDQCGRCKLCGQSPEGSRYSKLYIDHNHQTGKVRGLLCIECNFGLGKFKDNAELLDRASDYVRQDGDVTLPADL